MAHEVEEISTTTIVKNLFKKGSIAVLFRLTPPITLGLETYFISRVNTTHPGALAANGLVLPTRAFLTHMPGSFFNLLPLQFGSAMDKTENTANLWFAAQLMAFGLSIPVILIMTLASKDFFILVRQDAMVSQYAQDSLRSFSIGFWPLLGFSVNRQFIYSPCGDEASRVKYLLPLIGVVEAAAYGLFGYGLICGELGFPLLANAGDGYALSISNWLAFILSTGLLFGSNTLRRYLWHTPNASLIKKYMIELLRDGAPVSLRFVLENLSLMGFSLMAGAIDQDNLTALSICWTWLLLQTNPSFSFISGAKSNLKLDHSLARTAAALTIIPTTYAALWIIPYAAAAKPLTDVFLSGHTPASRLMIENINQKALPLLASAEVVNNIFHAQRAVLQKAKDNWYTTGSTFLFLCAGFLPTAYAFGKVLGYGVPGMTSAYLICMTALTLTIAARSGYVIKNPRKTAEGCLNPKRCWAMFFGSNEDRVPLLQENIQQLPAPPGPP